MAATSLRVDDGILKRFQARLVEESKKAGEKVSMNALVGGWMDSWSATGKDPQGGPLRPPLSVNNQRALADILASTVAQLLMTNKTWALNIVRTTHLRWPADGILNERMGHYPKDKLFVSEKFAEWLGLRIQHILDVERSDVYLLVDAGSTNLYFYYSLWNHLETISAVPRKNQIFIVSNNIAGAESFTEESHLGKFKGETAITYELLGGTVQARYAAVVGEMTQTALTARISQARRRPAHIISLVSGNWVRLSEKIQPAYPIPLIRGVGQKDVKELFIKLADESYILGAAPGKIFKARNDEINREMAELHKMNAGAGVFTPYSDVHIPKEKRAFVKLVTALREIDGAILKPHSAAVRARFGTTSEPSTEMAKLKIEGLPGLGQLCYQYDDPVVSDHPDAALSKIEQLPIEFPHLDWDSKSKDVQELNRQFVKLFFEVDLDK